MFFPSGDQSSPSASVAIASAVDVGDFADVESKSAIQTCDPPSLFEMNAKRFPSGAQRGRVAVLIGNKNAFLSSGQGDNPDMRRLGIGFEIDIDHAEEHPLAIRRRHGFAHALQFHHVFKREWMFGLPQRGD